MKIIETRLCVYVQYMYCVRKYIISLPLPLSLSPVNMTEFLDDEPQASIK